MNFGKAHEEVLPHPAAVHSVCSRDGDPYFVTTPRDSVYRATLDGRSGEWVCSRYWTFPRSSGERYENHLKRHSVRGRRSLRERVRLERLSSGLRPPTASSTSTI
jgi:hypothetical protein